MAKKNFGKLVIKTDDELSVDKLEFQGIDLMPVTDEVILIIKGNEPHVARVTLYLDDIDSETYVKIEPVIKEAMTNAGYQRLKSLYLDLRDKFEKEEE